MLVHHKVTPALHSPVPTHLYMCTLVERGIVRVKCLAQEQDTMKGLARTYHDTFALPHALCTLNNIQEEIGCAHEPNIQCPNSVIFYMLFIPENSPF